MKLLLTLALAVGLTSMASAYPYVVYSGTGSGTLTKSNGTVPVPKGFLTFYVVADVTDTSKFTVLQLDVTDQIYYITSRPSSAPLADEPANNFIGGLFSTGKTPGIGVFTYLDTGVAPNGIVTVSEAYATGAITRSNVPLVAARTKALTVTPKVNNVAGTPVTFPTHAAVTSGNDALAKAMAGHLHLFSIDTDGNLTQATSSSTISFKIDTAATTLINIGGGFTSGKNVYIFQPLTASHDPITIDFASWLTDFATAQGYALQD